MGRVFTLLLVIFALLKAAANAYESGSPKDVAAVRYDAERLLARTIAEHKKTPQDLNITDVVTDGDWALAVYTIGDYHGFMTLHKHWDQWWDMADGFLSANACSIYRTTPPLKTDIFQSVPFGLTDGCLSDAGLSAALVVQAQNVEAVRLGNAAENKYASGIKGKVLLPSIHTDPMCFTVCGDKLNENGGKIFDPWALGTGGYLTTLKYAKIMNSMGATVSRFYGRAPTENESTQHPNGDAFYFFTLELSGSKPVTFAQGATLDVWFPHVLLPNLRYRITAGFGTKSFGPISGTLSNNTLHYVLPEFTLAPHESMMFEIDGDP